MYTDAQIQGMITTFLNTKEFTDVLVLGMKTPVKDKDKDGKKKKKRKDQEPEPEPQIKITPEPSK